MRVAHSLPRFLLACLLLAIACGNGVAPSFAGDAVAGRERILALLRDHQLDELDRLLNEINDGANAQQRPEQDLVRAFRAFQTTDPQVTAELDAWIKDRPKSAMALVARGVHRYHHARITTYVEPLSAENEEVLTVHRRMGYWAYVDLQKGLELNKMIPIAYAWTLEFFIDLGRPFDVEDRYRLAVNELPASPAIQRAYLSSFVPWRQAGDSWQASLARQKEVWQSLHDGFARDADFAWLSGYLDYTMAEIYRRQGDLARALERYAAALAARPDAELLVGRGFVHLEAGDNKAALDDFGEAVRLDPESPEAVHGRGLAEAALADDAAALADFERAVAFDPYNPLYRVDRARVLRRLGRLEEARRDIDAALIYGKYDPWVLVWKGAVYEEADRQAAATAFKRAADLAPDDPAYVKRYMEFLLRHQDCQALPVVARYRELCETGEDCVGYSPAKLEQAESALKAQASCTQ